jgi:hypothetical protein
MERRNCICILYSDTEITKHEILDCPEMMIEKVIKLADKREEKTYKIQTKDGFTIFEHFYHHSTNGSKDIFSEHYLKENELTTREVVEVMLNGERLVDFEHSPDVANYHWYGENFNISDGYYIDSAESLKIYGLKKRYLYFNHGSLIMGECYDR